MKTLAFMTLTTFSLIGTAAFAEKLPGSPGAISVCQGRSLSPRMKAIIRAATMQGVRPESPVPYEAYGRGGTFQAEIERLTAGLESLGDQQGGLNYGNKPAPQRDFIDTLPYCFALKDPQFTKYEVHPGRFENVTPVEPTYRQVSARVIEFYSQLCAGNEAFLKNANDCQAVP